MGFFDRFKKGKSINKNNRVNRELLDVNIYEEDENNDVSKWYLNGKLFSGICFEKEPNSQYNYEREFENGIQNGPEIKFYENGNIKEEISYKLGIKDGYHKYYSLEGNLVLEELIEKQETVRSIHYPLSVTDVIDRKIMNEIQLDRNQTTNELSNKMNLNPTTINERLKNLNENGFIVDSIVSGELISAYLGRLVKEGEEYYCFMNGKYFTGLYLTFDDLDYGNILNEKKVVNGLSIEKNQGKNNLDEGESVIHEIINIAFKDKIEKYFKENPEEDESPLKLGDSTNFVPCHMIKDFGTLEGVYQGELYSGVGYELYENKKVEMILRFNENGKLMSNTSFHKNGQISQIHILKYDKNGKHIEDGLIVVVYNEDGEILK